MQFIQKESKAVNEFWRFWVGTDLLFGTLFTISFFLYWHFLNTKVKDHSPLKGFISFFISLVERPHHSDPLKTTAQRTIRSAPKCNFSHRPTFTHFYYLKKHHPLFELLWRDHYLRLRKITKRLCRRISKKALKFISNYNVCSGSFCSVKPLEKYNY